MVPGGQYPGAVLAGGVSRVGSVFAAGMTCALGTEEPGPGGSFAAGRLAFPARGLGRAGFRWHHRCRRSAAWRDLAGAAAGGVPLGGGVDAIVCGTCLPGNGGAGGASRWEGCRGVRDLAGFPAGRLRAGFGPGLASLRGTGHEAALGDRGRRWLAFREAAGFFGLNVHGGESLLEGLAGRLCRTGLPGVAGYLHRFPGEEGKHGAYFGGFCRRYARLCRGRHVAMAGDRDGDGAVTGFLFFAGGLLFGGHAGRCDVVRGHGSGPARGIGPVPGLSRGGLIRGAAGAAVAVSAVPAGGALAGVAARRGRFGGIRGIRRVVVFMREDRGFGCCFGCPGVLGAGTVGLVLAGGPGIPVACVVAGMAGGLA